MIEFTEEPIWYPLFTDDNKKDFEKSNLLLDLDEDLDEDEIKRGKQKKYLENVKIKELSFVSAGAVKKKYYIQKGDEREMLNEVKKSDNFKWSDNCQRIIRGYSDRDLEECDYEEEIEKSSDSNPFPSLASIFNRNKEALEEIYEDYAVEEGARFI